MKLFNAIVLIFQVAILYGCGGNSVTDSQRITNATDETTSIPYNKDLNDVKKNENKTSIEFHLAYTYSGLGANMGSLQPRFIVDGVNYKYQYVQNSYYGKVTKESEYLDSGKISPSTINSIIDLVKDIPDSVIYETNIDVMSGGIDYINIKTDSINITFNLHNATHPIAEKIVTLLNSHIPKKKRPLTLWKD